MDLEGTVISGEDPTYDNWAGTVVRNTFDRYYTIAVAQATHLTKAILNTHFQIIPL